MAPLPSVAGVVKVEFLWTQNGVPAANVLHASYTGDPPAPGDCGNLAAAIAGSFWTDDLKAFFSNYTTFVGCRVTDLSSDTGNVGEYADGSTGTIELEGVGAQMCIMVNYGISRRYRGGHPRTYYPGLSNTYLETPQTWDSAGVTAMETAVAALFSELGLASAGTTDLNGQVIVSYVTGGAPRVDPLVEFVNSAIVNGAVKTQRRRLTASSY